MPIGDMDPLVYDIQVERNLSRPEVAMHTLQRAVSLAKPLMRAHNFKVKLLAEFYPEHRGLLGLNTGQGMSIHLRLRYPVDSNQFFPFNMVMDSLLHELSHNRFGPHDENFHALWDQLRDEYVALTQRGFTGEAFLSQGYLLGGNRIPRDESRRIARNAATERRKKLPLTVNRKLGGAGPKPGEDMRSTITNAAFGRMQIAQGCACDMSRTEQKILVDKAGVNVLKSKVEEDNANEVAIQQALWELAQEDRAEMKNKALQGSTAAKGENSATSLFINRPSFSQAYDTSTRQSAAYDSDPDPSLKKPPPEYVQLVEEDLWQCTTCTLINKEEDLSCSACGVARPGTEPPKATPSKSPSKPVAKKASSKFLPSRSTPLSRLSPSRAVLARPQKQVAKAVPKVAPALWTCGKCSNMMESEWWTCSVCGTMKSTS